MKKKYIYAIFIISIFVALGLLFALIFLFTVIKNKNEHASKVLITLADKEADKKNNESLTNKYIELEELHNSINNYFVDPSKIDSFVEYLENIGVANQVDLTVKNVEVLLKEKDMILVRVSIIGNFNNVMKVIYLLENAPYYVSLTQAYVNKDIQEETQEEVVSPIWQADVSFKILSLPK